jgi:cytochrome c biogenesis protein CcmG/thiol:disulfide interchange protein DsbE
MNRTVLVTGTLLVAALVAILFLGLGRDPQHIESPLIGKPAPRFALRAVGSGQTIDISALRGRPVVLNFWATWCGPCWEEHPNLTAAAQETNGRVQFLGVVFQDEESKIQAFLTQRGSAYPTVIDEGGKTAIAYGVGGVPETFFLDANGTIVAKFDGPLAPDQLQTYLAKVMR